MFQQLYHVRLLFKRLLIVLGVFFACRILFYAFNYHFFPSFSPGRFFMILIYGLRFDIAAIIYFNLLFILLHLLPFPVRGRVWYQKMLKVVFYLFNGVALLLIIPDFIYFQFTHKRTTSEVLFILPEFLELFSSYLADFWYLLLILTALVAGIEFLYRRVSTATFLPGYNHWIQILIFVLSIGIFLIGARGGLQYKPIAPISAAGYYGVTFAPLISNTPFVFLHSLQQKKIKEKPYFTDVELNKIYTAHHTAFSRVETSRDNVVIIILESFAKDFIGSLSGKEGFTPFLDSLIKESLVCTNAYSNGLHSHEGLISVLGGIPPLMEDPFHYSIYQGNKFKGIGALMKEMGYHTSFFHGGSNGTFNFDDFTRASGFEHYYGRTEYNNEADYDGGWGIFDEPFFQYFAHRLEDLPRPFCSAIFSLTSHHPFPIPEKYKEVFNGDIEPIHKTIRYTDYALRKFFETASQTSWFDSTLFIITADHTFEAVVANSKEGLNKVKLFAIPILFYKKGSSLQGVYPGVAQQIDILPSILDYIGYPHSYFSFGNSIFDASRPRFAVQYHNSMYQLIEDPYILMFDGEKSREMYDYCADKNLKANLINGNQPALRPTENLVKAVLQTYNYSMIYNKLTIE